MPAQLQNGTNFIDGNTYGATDFNAAVDSGTILPGLITEQANIGTAPVGADQFVGVQASTGHLFNTTLTQLIAGFPTDDANTVPSLRSLGTGSGKAAAGDDGRFPAQFQGIRMANNSAPDTAATPENMKFPTIVLTGSGGSVNVDWTLGNQFYAILATTTTYVNLNGATGRQITLTINLQGHSVNLPVPSLGTMQSFGNGTAVVQATYTFTPAGITGFKVLM